MRIDPKRREMLLGDIAQHGRMGDSPCTVCGSPTVVVNPETNTVSRWCLCGDKIREAIGRPTLWEALIAMGENNAADEVMGNPFEPVTDALLECEAARNAGRARNMGEVRERLDDRFGLSG